MLIPKLLKELKPGTRVVSHRTDMGEWKPDVSLRGYGSDVYLWFIPAQVDGEWHLTITAKKNRGGKPSGLIRTIRSSRGRTREESGLQGDRALWQGDRHGHREQRVGPWSVMELSGHVDGDTMEGTAGGEGPRRAVSMSGRA